ISWRCIFHPIKTDYELIKIMYEAGCREVSVGFESGSELVLKMMNKSFSPKDVIEASKMLKKTGIIQMGFLLLGGPSETKESVIQSLEFADSLNPDAMRVTTGIRIYPHTALARLAREEGMISKDDDLLYPKFYIVKGLEDWLRKTVKEWAVKRPHWIL
ncbi:radical SAM protein, partial [bacterium]|nr:radical SAM protein [bacterium]